MLGRRRPGGAGSSGVEGRHPGGGSRSGGPSRAGWCGNGLGGAGGLVRVGCSATRYGGRAGGDRGGDVLGAWREPRTSAAGWGGGGSVVPPGPGRGRGGGGGPGSSDRTDRLERDAAVRDARRPVSEQRSARPRPAPRGRRGRPSVWGAPAAGQQGPASDGPASDCSRRIEAWTGRCGTRSACSSSARVGTAADAPAAAGGRALWSEARRRERGETATTHRAGWTRLVARAGRVARSERSASGAVGSRGGSTTEPGAGGPTVRGRRGFVSRGRGVCVGARGGG
jgi:hypothetical protein